MVPAHPFEDAIRRWNFIHPRREPIHRLAGGTFCCTQGLACPGSSLAWGSHQSLSMFSQDFHVFDCSTVMNVPTHCNTILLSVHPVADHAHPLQALSAERVSCGLVFLVISSSVSSFHSRTGSFGGMQVDEFAWLFGPSAQYVMEIQYPLSVGYSFEIQPRLAPTGR